MKPQPRDPPRGRLRSCSMLSRRVVLALACLIIGLLATVAIAWAASAWVPIADALSIELPPQRSAGQTTIDFEQRAFGRTRLNRLIDHSGSDAGNAYDILTLDATSDVSCEGRELAGWPCRALQTRRPGEVSWAGPSSTGSMTLGTPGLERGIALPDERSSAGNMIWRALPCQPIWPGFIANVVFYAVLSGGVPFACLTAVRRRRRARGLCVHCRYDLRGGPDGGVCPECGR